MAEPDPSENPFAGIPFLGDIAKAMASQGAMHWDIARQLAMLGATEGNPDQNVDPASRIAAENLLPIALMHIREVSGIELEQPKIDATTSAMWAHNTLETYRPLFEELATSLASAPTESSPDDPMAAMFAGIARMMGPSILGMSIGSMIGQLSRRAFGQYDLPLPRSNKSLVLVPANIEAFADEWSLQRDDARMWTLLHELASHVFFSVNHTRDAVWNAVHDHVKGFRIDSGAAMTRMSDLDIDTDSEDPFGPLQKMFSDPEVMLGTTTSPAQQANRPRLDALIALAIGYTDFIVDQCASRLLGTSSPIGEALRRRRLESSQVDMYVEHLLGLRLEKSHVERGRSFITGVIEREGINGLNKVFASAEHLPTPAEIDAPGLWLARIELLH